MQIDLLISTVNREMPIILKNNPYFLKCCNAIVIDQVTKKLDQKNNKFFEFNEAGISKSRNRAIELATADVCLICDNDIHLVPDFKQIIIDSFEKYSNADFLTFKIKTPDGDEYKTYKNKAFQHTSRSILKVSSIEIVFRRKPFIDKRIRFDERFGIGSLYKSGEEVIFLRDAMKNGLKGWFIPKILTIHEKESTGKDYSNPDVFVDKGAVFVRIFGLRGIMEAIKMAIKRRHKYNYSTFYAIKNGIAGGIEFYIKKNHIY